VLCDLEIPRLDGYAVVRSLRANAGWRRAPLIAVSALASRSGRERALAAGFDAYLAKPIAPETFVREVEGFLPAARSTPAAAAAGAR
jgi:CheY-like chemotaxis protein